MSCADSVVTIKLDEGKSSVKFALVGGDDTSVSALANYRFALPKMSNAEIEQKIVRLTARILEIDREISSYGSYSESIKNAIKSVKKDVEFETYSTGMENELVSEKDDSSLSVAYFKGYVEAKRVDELKKSATDNAWGLFIEDPSEEDNVPTKLKNNKFVSLIYPLTDFLGTVPGYFEYDISGWFLAFILVFFGIIF